MALCLRSGHCPRCHAGRGRRSVSGGQHPSHPALEVAPMGGWSTPAAATSPFTVLLKPRPERSKLLSGVPPFLSTKRCLQEQKTLGTPPTGQHPGSQTSGLLLAPPSTPSSWSTPQPPFPCAGTTAFYSKCCSPHFQSVSSIWVQAPGLSQGSRHPGSPITSLSGRPNYPLNPKSSISFPAYCL